MPTMSDDWNVSLFRSFMFLIDIAQKQNYGRKSYWERNLITSKAICRFTGIF